MDLINSRINRRTLGGIAIGTAASASLARFATAQDATPEVDGVDTAAATLADLEAATQVTVVVNETSYAPYLGDENQPGWYVFNLENESGSDASFNVARLPEDVAIGDFTSFLFQLTSGQLTELPEWLLDVTFAGGTYVPVDENGSTMVNLDPGEWIMFSDLAASAQRVTTFQVLEPQVEEGEEEEDATPEVAEPAAVMAPEGFGSSFTVSVADGAINADSSPAVGYNIIGVRNDASMAANFMLLHVHDTEVVDEAAAADLAASWLAGEETDSHLAGGMGILDTNAFGYIELEAEAGTYIGFSSVVNAAGGTQLEDGAVTVFNVG